MNKLLLGGSDFSSPLMWLRGNQSNQETLLCSAIKIKKTLLNTARYYSTGKHYHFNVEYFSYLRLIDILTAFMSSSNSLFIHTIIFFFPGKTDFKRRTDKREKWPHQGKMSPLEGTKNWGSIRHHPPPHPPLINSFLNIDKSCLLCGNNIF